MNTLIFITVTPVSGRPRLGKSTAPCGSQPGIFAIDDGLAFGTRTGLSEPYSPVLNTVSTPPSLPGRQGERLTPLFYHTQHPCKVMRQQRRVPSDHPTTIYWGHVTRLRSIRASNSRLLKTGRWPLYFWAARIFNRRFWGIFNRR